MLCGYSKSKKSCSNFCDTSAIFYHGSCATTLFVWIVVWLLHEIMQRLLCAVLHHGSCATTLLEQLCGYSKKSCSDFYDTSTMCHGSCATTLLQELCGYSMKSSMIPVQYCLMVAMPLLCWDSCVATQ